MTALWDETDLERYDSPNEPHRPGSDTYNGRHHSDETSTSPTSGDATSGSHRLEDQAGGYPVSDRTHRPHHRKGWWPSR